MLIVFLFLIFKNSHDIYFIKFLLLFNTLLTCPRCISRHAISTSIFYRNCLPLLNAFIILILTVLFHYFLCGYLRLLLISNLFARNINTSSYDCPCNPPITYFFSFLMILIFIYLPVLAAAPDKPLPLFFIIQALNLYVFLI